MQGLKWLSFERRKEGEGGREEGKGERVGGREEKERQAHIGTMNEFSSRVLSYVLKAMNWRVSLLLVNLG